MRNQRQSKKARVRLEMPTGDAARVFVVSKNTWGKWRREGKLTAVRHYRAKRGWLFDMVDVFEMAYPTADRDTIALLMRDFRADKLRRRGK